MVVTAGAPIPEEPAADTGKRRMRVNKCGENMERSVEEPNQ